MNIRNPKISIDANSMTFACFDGMVKLDGFHPYLERKDAIIKGTEFFSKHNCKQIIRVVFPNITKATLTSVRTRVKKAIARRS